MKQPTKQTSGVWSLSRSLLYLPVALGLHDTTYWNLVFALPACDVVNGF
jgi:hypothetical protein